MPTPPTSEAELIGNLMVTCLYYDVAVEKRSMREASFLAGVFCEALQTAEFGFDWPIAFYLRSLVQQREYLTAMSECQRLRSEPAPVGTPLPDISEFTGP